MLAVVSHLLSRGVGLASQASSPDPDYKMPSWGVAMLATTAVIFIVKMSMVSPSLRPVQHRLTPTRRSNTPLAVSFQPS